MKLKTIKTILAAALCAVGLSSFAAEPEAVQLWEGGPYWATVNVGEPEAHDPPYPLEYGALYMFSDDEAKKAAESFGEGWRLPTKEDFENLISKCDYKWTEQNGIKGRLIIGNMDGYKDKSIFLPVAGCSGDPGRTAGSYGHYWSSSEKENSDKAWMLYIGRFLSEEHDFPRSTGMSVRAVRGSAK